MTEKYENKENILLFLTTVSKPIWYPAMKFGKFSKEVGEEILDGVRNGKVGDIAGGFFIFAMITGMVVAFLCMLSLIFLKLWVAMLITMYLSMFYIRDSYKRKNK